MVFSPEHHEVLHHLFAQVVIYTVDLLFSEEGGEVSGQFLRALQVTSKRLLYNHPVPASAQTQNNDTYEKPLGSNKMTDLRAQK